MRVTRIDPLSFRNLADREVALGPGLTVLHGPNGAGKTNLLECLALLLGSDLTLRLAGSRLLDPEPGSLSFVARVAPDLLPWSPDLTLPWSTRSSDTKKSSMGSV
ncbi:MAG: AAA family ATPase, partial [Solirubrobacterales bacterium]|nr:AAA family ATPase [Solirubrobacterales bacterium]